MSSQQNPIKDNNEAAARGRAYGVAVELAGSIVGMALIGWLIDKWRGTSPLWTLILIALGTVGGFYNFFKKATALNREQAEALKSTRARRPAPPPTRQAAAPDLFERNDASHDGDDDHEPNFDLPPDVESALERRVRRLEQGEKNDANN